MSTEEPLTKVDSAVGGVDETPKTGERERRKSRLSSSAPGVKNVAELQEEGIDLVLSKDTQRTGWKINSGVNSVDDPSVLKKLLTEPPVKKIDLVFPQGLTVTARNLKGVTIKDALDAIHKQFKKKADDELEEPYLKGFEWDKEESWTQLKVHLSKNSTAEPVGGGKKKKNKGGDIEE